uniref:Epl101 n=1 Tax=Arundo donax TaxID=35708 RepID=A0A0A9DHV9_ARUDO
MTPHSHSGPPLPCFGTLHRSPRLMARRIQHTVRRMLKKYPHPSMMLLIHTKGIILVPSHNPQHTYVEEEPELRLVILLSMT